MSDTWLSATDSLFNHFSGMYRGKKWRKQNKNAQFPSRAINAVFILISCVRCSQTSTTKNSLMMTHEYNKITHNGTNTTLNETWTSLEFTSKQGSDKGLPKKSTALHQGHSATTTGYTFKHKWLNSGCHLFVFLARALTFIYLQVQIGLFVERFGLQQLGHLSSNAQSEKKNALVQMKETCILCILSSRCHLKSNQPPTVTFLQLHGNWGSFCSSLISLLDHWLNDIKEKNKTWHVLYLFRLFSFCDPNSSNIEQCLLACICHIEFKLGCLFLATRPLFKNPVLHMQSKYREVKPSTKVTIVIFNLKLSKVRRCIDFLNYRKYKGRCRTLTETC